LSSFFSTATPPPQSYTLSLHDALPISRCDLVAVDVQPLRCDVDVDPAFAVGDRQARLRAEKRLILDPDLIDAGDRHLAFRVGVRSEEHTSELQSLAYLVCRLLLEKKKK